MSSLMLEVKAKSLPYRVVPERCSARVDDCLANVKLGWKGLPRTNTLPYFLGALLNYGHRKFQNIDRRFQIEISLKSATLGATVAQW